jgi:ribosome recycling factor
MNRLYLLIPLVLLGLFAVPYGAHRRETAAAAREQAAEADRRQQAAAAEQQAAALKARADADQRTSARLAAEQQAAAAKHAQGEAESQRIAVDTDSYRAAATKLTAEIADLQIQLHAARATRAGLNDEVFAAEKAVELARIDKRNAEMELQRLTAKVAEQAAGVALPVLPTLPTQ